MSYVGTIRSARTPLYEWCANTLEMELVEEDSLLLCFDNPGYVRAYCLDDGRTYHISNNNFDLLADIIT